MSTRPLWSLGLQVKAMKTFLPINQHIQRQEICPYNILTSSNFANTMHLENDKMRPDHMTLVDELVRQNKSECSVVSNCLDRMRCL